MIDLSGFIGIVIFPTQDGNGVSEVPEWKKSGIDQKEYSATQQQDQQGSTPGQVTETNNDLFCQTNFFQSLSFILFHELCTNSSHFKYSKYFRHLLHDPHLLHQKTSIHILCDPCPDLIIEA